MSEQRDSKEAARGHKGRLIPIPEDDWRAVDGKPLGDVVMRYDPDDAFLREGTVYGSRTLDVMPEVIIVDQLPSAIDYIVDSAVANHTAASNTVVAADGPMVIDGVATLIERVMPEGLRVPAQTLETTSDSARPNQPDDIIIATLNENHQTLNAGGTARYQISLVNNGPEIAIFKARVEGEMPPGWLQIDPPYIQLAPGKRTSFEVEVTPPRDAESKAGSHRLTFVIDGSEYPGRQCVLQATLTIAPYFKIHLGQLRPQPLEAAWQGSNSTLMIPVTNQGNGAATVRLQAVERSDSARSARDSGAQDQRCSFELYDPNAESSGFGQIQVTLQAGQDILVPLRIEPHVRPLISLKKLVIPFRVLASVVGRNRTPQEVQGQFVNQPLISPWQLASLTGFSLVIAMGFFLGALMLGTIFWFNNPRTEAAINLQQQAAPMAIIIKVAEPVPTSAGLSQPSFAQPSFAQPTSAQPTSAQPTSAQPTLVKPTLTQPVQNVALNAPVQNMTATPIPTRASITPTPTDSPPSAAPIQPQSPTVQPTNSLPAPTLEVSTPLPQSEESRSEPVTYEQMFQEIAQQYDLDWRMLAAQAYVESSFDPNAVGLDGDMGLMQIIPMTWREWAPKVNAEDPFDSYSNAIVAATYLDYLRTQLGKRGYTDPKWMLVAYNWGPGNLFNFLDDDQPWDALDTKVKQYAQKILRITNGIPE